MPFLFLFSEPLFGRRSFEVCLVDEQSQREMKDNDGDDGRNDVRGDGFFGSGLTVLIPFQLRQLFLVKH